MRLRRSVDRQRVGVGVSRRADLTRELGECVFNDDIVSACLASMTETTSDRDVLLSMVRHMAQDRKKLRQVCVKLTETQTPHIHITCQRCGFTPYVTGGKEDASKG